MTFGRYVITTPKMEKKKDYRLCSVGDYNDETDALGLRPALENDERALQDLPCAPRAHPFFGQVCYERHR